MCPAGATKAHHLPKKRAGMPVLQAVKTFTDTQMQLLMANATKSSLMGVPEGIFAKIHTSGHFGSHGRRVTLPRKKKPGRPYWSSGNGYHTKKNIDYSVIDYNKCTVPGQGAPNPLWQEQVNERGDILTGVRFYLPKRPVFGCG